MIKNDNFRLIFVTKSVLIPDDVKKTFEVMFIDEVKLDDEELLDNLQRKAPS